MNEWDEAEQRSRSVVQGHSLAGTLDSDAGRAAQATHRHHQSLQRIVDNGQFQAVIQESIFAGLRKDQSRHDVDAQRRRDDDYRRWKLLSPEQQAAELADKQARREAKKALKAEKAAQHAATEVARKKAIWFSMRMLFVYPIGLILALSAIGFTLRHIDDFAWKSGSGLGRQVFLNRFGDPHIHDITTFLSPGDRSHALPVKTLIEQLLADKKPNSNPIVVFSSAAQRAAINQEAQLRTTSAYVCELDFACRNAAYEQSSVGAERMMKQAILFLNKKAEAGDARAAEDMCVISFLYGREIGAMEDANWACWLAFRTTKNNLTVTTYFETLEEPMMKILQFI